MLPIIRLRTESGAESIVVFRAAVRRTDAKNVYVYEHGDPDEDAYWTAEPGVTIDDIQRAVDESIQRQGVGRVVATGPGRRLTFAEV